VHGDARSGEVGPDGDLVHARLLPRRRPLAAELLQLIRRPDHLSLRIAVVASLVTPLREAQLGGAQALLTDLARALAGRGHAVTVVLRRRLLAARPAAGDAPAPAGVERALVMPAGAPPPPLAELRRAFERLFAAVRSGGATRVSQHAFDAEAFELAAGLPVLLHPAPAADRPAVVAAPARPAPAA